MSKGRRRRRISGKVSGEVFFGRHLFPAQKGKGQRHQRHVMVPTSQPRPSK